MDVYVRLSRVEGYEDADTSLIIEDARIQWPEYSDATPEIARLVKIARDPNYSDEYVGGVCRGVLTEVYYDGPRVPDARDYRIAELEAQLEKAQQWVPHVGARIAYTELEAEVERLERELDVSGYVERTNELLAQRDEARAEVVKLKAELVRNNTELGRVKDLVVECCNNPIWDRL